MFAPLGLSLFHTRRKKAHRRDKHTWRPNVSHSSADTLLSSPRGTALRLHAFLRSHYWTQCLCIEQCCDVLHELQKAPCLRCLSGTPLHFRAVWLTHLIHQQKSIIMSTTETHRWALRWYHAAPLSLSLSLSLYLSLSLPLSLLLLKTFWNSTNPIKAWARLSTFLISWLQHGSWQLFIKTLQSLMISDRTFE